MILSIAENFNQLEIVRRTQVSGSTVTVDVLLKDMEYSLEVDLQEPFPKILPPIRLQTASQYGYLPHVCWKGVVCYNDGEGLSIDGSRPIDVAVYALKKAVSALPSTSCVDLDDFYDEYEGYWNQQDKILLCQLFFDPGLETKEIRILEDKKNSPVSMISLDGVDNPDSKYGFAGGFNAKKTQIRGYSIPLDRCVEPPLPGDHLPLGFLDTVFSALSPDTLQKWDAIVQLEDFPKRLTLLISQPRPSGGRSFFGVNVPAAAFNAWLHNKEYDKPIIPLVVLRHTREFLVERGGMEPVNNGGRVAIIGCGALGCRVAELCAMGGIAHLTLVDGELFSAENIFRHILNSRFIHANKADALRDSFLDRFPGISITAISKQIETIDTLIRDHDTVVVATGNPTMEKEFHLQYKRSKGEKNTHFITTWLEAGGVGGHAVLSNNDVIGCLHCLYHRDGSPSLSSLFSLIEPGQVVTKNLTGCGGAFVPYGAVHAIKTAVLVFDLMTDCQGMNKTDYRFWSSNQNSGCELDKSHWFYESLNDDASEKSRELFREGCPVCR
ncbi:MAG: ThiF family adenylyltransferase [Arenicella sp.]|nr:ThiF family adenylyltransferase [Arenicella sp.]